jgi:dienelactone hydrolase
VRRLPASLAIVLTLAVSACAARGVPTQIPGESLMRSDLYMERHGFRRDSRTYGPIQRVYVIGSGAPVVLLHELPGLREGDVLLGAELGKYFEVHMPLMFGVAGQDSVKLGLNQACGDEKRGALFSCRKTGANHPITASLHQLVAETCAADRTCAVIGMCLTGTLPLSLVDASPNVVSLVLAQPTLPLTLKWWSSALDISDAAIETALQTAADRKVSILLTRFEHDLDSRHAAFDRLKGKLRAKHGLDVEVHEVEGHGHSTLIPQTGDHAVQAELMFHLLVQSLRKKLPARAPSPI